MIRKWYRNKFKYISNLYKYNFLSLYRSVGNGVSSGNHNNQQKSSNSAISRSFQYPL